MVQLAVTGLISNLDTDSIIDALVEVRRQPAALLEQKQETQSSLLVALQNLNARMLSLSVSTSSLSDTRTFQANQANSSNTSVLMASATYLADPGSYTIEVQTLAQSHSIAGGTFADQTEALELEGQFFIDGELITVESSDSLSTIATAINNQTSTVRASVLEVADDEYRLVLTRREAGAESIELFEASASGVLSSLGLIAGTSTIANPVTNGGRGVGLTEDSTAVGSLLELSSPAPSGTITLDDGSGPINVAIDLEADSLQAIATAINDEATLQGSTVTASVVTEEVDGETVYRLEITGDDSVSFTDDNNVLQSLQILQADFADEVQVGQDAAFSVNGVDITRSSNLVLDVIDGVTLLLNSADPGTPVTLNIQRDTSSAVSALQSFVDGYNEARSYILAQTSFDAETLQAGVLLGDSAVMSVERNMYDLLGTRVANVLLENLSDLNGGSGVDNGTIEITDRSGATAEIDLSSATSVQDIIDAINASAAISVTASTKADGSGLLLQDTSGGSGVFEVRDVGASTTAADLGLAQSVSAQTLYGDSVTDAGFVSLVDIGITSASNGLLSLDLGTLNQALSNNPLMVERMFTATDVGIGQVAADKLEFITQSQGGTISSRTTAIQNVIDDIDERLEVLEWRLLQYEMRLQDQFAQMELTLAELQSTSDYLAGQFASLLSND